MKPEKQPKEEEQKKEVPIPRGKVPVPLIQLAYLEADYLMAIGNVQTVAM
jgi:hypothetical protein